MTKTIESIIIGLSLATILGCESSKEEKILCTPEYILNSGSGTQNEIISYEVSKQLCEKKGDIYECTRNQYDSCVCDCVEPPKDSWDKEDKGW